MGGVCDCDGCREFRAIHGAFSLEVPYAERLAKRARDREAQRRYLMAEAVHAPTLPRAV